MEFRLILFGNAMPGLIPKMYDGKLVGLDASEDTVAIEVSETGSVLFIPKKKVGEGEGEGQGREWHESTVACLSLSARSANHYPTSTHRITTSPPQVLEFIPSKKDRPLLAAGSVTLVSGESAPASRVASPSSPETVGGRSTPVSFSVPGEAGAEGAASPVSDGHVPSAAFKQAQKKASSRRGSVAM